MICELLAIGNEILDGRVIDTNSSYLGSSLHQMGLSPRYAQRVDDHKGRIAEAFKIACARSQIIIVSGGLGPTQDDLTLEAYADFAGLRLVENSEAKKMVEAVFEKMKRPLLPVQYKQALLPEGSKALFNPQGTAPGVYIKDAKTKAEIFFLPGVPKELKAIFEDSVIKILAPHQKHFLHYLWATHFTSEGKLAEDLKDIISKADKGFEFTFRTRMPENFIGLTAPRAKADAAQLVIKEVSQKIAEQCFWYGEGSEAPSLEATVLKAALSKKVFLGTVESCTGGLIAERLSSISGASEVFLESQVTYANESKIKLGVPAEIIQSKGAVSAECAASLATLGLTNMQKTLALQGRKDSPALCVSTTGIAGPGGGSSNKAVGLCFLGVAHSNGDVFTKEIQTRLGLNRIENQRYFSQVALDLLRQKLLS